jgi:hypothetical protein
MNNNDERRLFSRIPFEISAFLFGKSGGPISVDLLDISLQGLLIHKPDNWKATLGETFKAEITLESSNVQLKMVLSVAHISDDHIGFHCDNIDLESISHLKRLVELNIGDNDLLERELHALIHG